MERGTTALMRRGAEATWQGCGWPTRGAGGAQAANTWQEATRVHADARVGCHVAEGVDIWRAHVLVGPSKIVGPVTRKRYTAPQFILNIVQTFFHVGLCPTRFLPVQDAWRLSGRRIPSGRWRSRGPE